MHSRHGLAALLFLLLPADAPAQVIIESDGAAELGVALRRLGTTSRILMVAAHPDDENTALIAELALGAGADVAYLSLTRGEGGQNLIGPELQEGLGLIRSEELLAARRLDGARQFFTRAYDYGYSKTAEEAFTQWPRDSLLADVVEVVRRYRPDVMVSVFSGTPADGHGQHQAAGIMARDAFTAAADPAQFTGQIARGLRPHAAAYLFQALYRPPADPPLRLQTGEYDALFGRSRYQIAMQSRSRHRSQDMGMAEPIGPQTTALRVMAGPYPDGAQSLFAGIDTTLSQHAHRAAAPAEAVALLARYEFAVTDIRSSFNPLRRSALVAPLRAAISTLDSSIALLGASRFDELRHRVSVERRQAADALRLDAGLLLDVVASTPTPVPGSAFDLNITVWNGGLEPVGLSNVVPVLPRGWTAVANLPSAPSSTLAPGEVLRHVYRVTVPQDAEPTRSYFLRTPRDGAMYDWTAVPDSVRGLPFEPFAIGAAIELDVGVSMPIAREAEYAVVDKAFGEVRRPLIVVPAASVSVEPRIAAIPLGTSDPLRVAITVSAARDSMRGILRLRSPSGWRISPNEVDVLLARAGDAQTILFDVHPAVDAAGEHVVDAAFRSGGLTYEEGFSVIDYPHIRPHPLYHNADMRAVVFPVRIADDLRIGYIEGAGDGGADALRQLGADVELLDGAALANADLSVYDAIVAGIRAYEVRPDVIANNARLIDYARGGGTFVVQYNKYEIIEGGFMPYPASMARPHGRVADEAAPVTLIAPDHPILSWPNRITSADFAGWAHERGLYYLDTFDPRYTAPLAMADPGEEPLTGGLVVAPVGSGWYVYTGLAFFRQLPEGVTGAYRLLANLVSLGRSQDAGTDGVADPPALNETGSRNVP